MWIYNRVVGVRVSFFVPNNDLAMIPSAKPKKVVLVIEGDSHLPDGARDRTFTAAAAAAAAGDTSSCFLPVIAAVAITVREGVAQHAPVLQENELARPAYVRQDKRREARVRRS